MTAALMGDARALAEQLSTWRRHLHAHPELSWQEEQTSRYVAAELKKIGLAPQERLGGTFGLTALLEVPGSRAIALRADMDALPVQEETGLPYASRNPGVMHACGHDAHTAMLLGAARLLVQRRAELRRSVKFIFQPAEETAPGGASKLVAAGVLAGVETAFGLHISSMLAPGEVGTRVGPFMAAVNNIHIRIAGTGGHAAMPEQCIDPIVVAAQIIAALQTVVSRSIAMTDPAVVSITKLEAGTTDNVIPPVAQLTGTIRTYDEAIRARVCSRVKELAEGIARSFGAAAEVELPAGYPVLVNDAAVTEKAIVAARQLGVADAQIRMLPPQGGAEDFAYYGQHVPAAFVFLGAGDPTQHCTYPHHHPRFNIDEGTLPTGAALLAQFALNG